MQRPTLIIAVYPYVIAIIMELQISDDHFDICKVSVRYFKVSTDECVGSCW
jgi:hypothetical protein